METMCKKNGEETKEAKTIEVGKICGMVRGLCEIGQMKLAK